MALAKENRHIITVVWPWQKKTGTTKILKKNIIRLIVEECGVRHFKN